MNARRRCATGVQRSWSAICSTSIRCIELLPAARLCSSTCRFRMPIFPLRFPEAIAEFQKAVDESNRIQLAVTSLARAYALAGKRAGAEKLLAELKERSGREYVSSYLV